MITQRLTDWLYTHPITPTDIDCATTVMLKILDGKCKMLEEEKVVMTLLYDQVKTLSGKLFGSEYHALIAQARLQADEELKMYIYEKRLLAETMLSRPVMKQFKAMIRDHGLFAVAAVPANEQV